MAVKNLNNATIGNNNNEISLFANKLSVCKAQKIEDKQNDNKINYGPANVICILVI